MREIRLNLKGRTYKIIIGTDIIGYFTRGLKSLNLGQGAYVITNPYIKNKFGGRLSSALRASGHEVKFKVVPDSEKSKSLENAFSVIRGLTAFDKKKKVFIIALGGGVIGDLAGFVASVYKRGTPYVQVPTTLLAQVDSSIGGKTAVDLDEGKNLVGAFYQPALVLSDLSFLKSLDPRQVASGLAEVIKYALIKDKRLFGYLIANLKDVKALKAGALEYIVFRSSAIKSAIVEKDEKEEKGLRTILNFGHTFGHAIEAAGNFKEYNHGEAVALGMLCALDLSRKKGYLSESLVLKIEDLIKDAGLPAEIKGVTVKKVIAAHYRDKKFSGAINKFVLLKGIGRAVVETGIPLGLIREVLKERSG